MKTLTLNYNTRHAFHIVDFSPWPALGALAAAQIVLSLVAYFHYASSSSFYLFISLFQLSWVLFRWFSDITTESTIRGQHTSLVRRGLRLGMVLFILSEVMFFFSFFWTFFHVSVSPSIWVGCLWPPAGVLAIDFTTLPLLNTALLLSSGVAVTYAHRALTADSASDIGKRGRITHGLVAAITYGVLFTAGQLFEYNNAPFSINDGIYGSTFFLMTGFHGLHVLIGTCFLYVCLLRHRRYHFSQYRHLGLEFAIWYWHFVDVVWLFLYLFVYVWSASELIADPSGLDNVPVAGSTPTPPPSTVTKEGSPVTTQAEWQPLNRYDEEGNLIPSSRPRTPQEERWVNIGCTIVGVLWIAFIWYMGGRPPTT